MRRRSILSASLVLGMTALPVTPAAALTGSVTATWSSTPDVGADGALTGDVIQFLRTATNPDRRTDKPVQINAADQVYAAGTAYHGSNSATPRNDTDVILSAYDSETGEPTWTTVFDCGLFEATREDIAGATDTSSACFPAVETSEGIPGQLLPNVHTSLETMDELVAFDIDGNNNQGYATINTAGVVRFQKFSLRDGAASIWNGGSFEIPGAIATSADQSWPGGTTVTAGSKDNNFWFASHEVGLGTENFQVSLGRGRANAVDLHRVFTTDRSALVTGYDTTGLGGNIRTVLATFRGNNNAPVRWSAVWDSPVQSADIGVAAEQANVDGIGRVSYVLGSTRRAKTGPDTDLVVLAYDNATGALLWERIWGAVPGLADKPVDLAFNNKAQLLHVVATSDRGGSDGDDVAVLTLSPTSGEVLASTFVGGDIANGDDAAAALEVSPDGERVVVMGQFHNFNHTGGRVEAVAAFDPMLHPAGTAVVTEKTSGLVRGGIAFTHGYGSPQDLVVGSRTTGTGGLPDHQAHRFPIADFAVQTIATQISFLAETASEVVAGDPAAVAARLLDANGAPIADAAVTLGLGPDTASITTDADGVARTVFNTEGLRGTYALTADHAGDGMFLPSQAESTVEVVRLASTLTFDPFTTTSQAEVGDPVVATVNLVDEQGQSPANAVVTLTFADQSVEVQTDDSGRASTEFATDDLEAGSHALTASFAGDDRREPATTVTSVSLSVPEPTFLASASRTHKGVTLHATANDVADETVQVTFAPEYFVDSRESHGNGNAYGRLEAAQVRDLTIVVSQVVDGVLVELARVTRAGDMLIADGSADWLLELEAIDAAGQYRVDVTGTYLDASGAELKGRGVKLHVDLA